MTLRPSAMGYPLSTALVAPQPSPADRRRVAIAVSLGTLFEWYDFYLYGAMADVVAQKFFAALDPRSAFVFAMLAFASGFIVRPFGALLFGRFGDMIGRKYTFVVTILTMGLATFMVGMLPEYADIGVAAPLILVALRLLQGLALGGEYGGAATYVAEHAPQGRRGAYMSWMQTTATGGLLLALAAVIGVRALLGPQAFFEWGWRLPFLGSAVLLLISFWARMNLSESPAFVRIRQQGKTSKSPLSEAFGRWDNLRVVLAALFGLAAGQGVVWYTGQFYTLFFLTRTLKVDDVGASLMLGLALLIATPTFWLFGSLSDRVGRKPVILGGCLIAALSYLPLFHAMTGAANPALAQALQRTPVTLVAAPAECSFQFNPTGAERFTSSCDVAKQLLAAAGVDYEEIAGRGLASIRVGGATIASFDGARLPAGEFTHRRELLRARLTAAMRAAGYPAAADPARIDRPLLLAILVILVVEVAMVYAPVAAALAELFPTRIRHTSLSLPYNIGNGWFGGVVPTVAFALVAQNGNIYYGLWYPIIVAYATVTIGVLFLPETRQRDILAHD